MAGVRGQDLAAEDSGIELLVARSSVLPLQNNRHSDKWGGRRGKHEIWLLIRKGKDRHRKASCHQDRSKCMYLQQLLLIL